MSSARPWGEAAPPPKGPGAVSAAVVLVCLATLVGLGVWQLYRLKWKEGLLKHVAELQAAPARPLADGLKAGGDLDFTRVSFDCPDLLNRPRAKVYGVQDGQIVYRQMAACPLPDGRPGSVMVDVGYEDCASKSPVPPFSGPLTGILRKPDARTFVTPPDQPAQRLWYWRDLPSMAAALKAAPPLPLFLALERGPQPASGCRLARTPIPNAIPNRHFDYALTWFGLAAALIGVYAAMLLRRRRI
jgi:surfeit locus 1 family protein